MSETASFEGESKKEPEPPMKYPEVLKMQLEVPRISRSLIEVYRVGGFPLATLFVVVVVLLILIREQYLKIAGELISVVSFVVVFLAFASLVSLLTLSAIGYLRWRDELRARVDERCARLDNFTAIYKVQAEARDKIISVIVTEAWRAAVSPQGIGAGQIGTVTDAIQGAVEKIAPALMKQLETVSMEDLFGVAENSSQQGQQTGETH